MIFYSLIFTYWLQIHLDHQIVKNESTFLFRSIKVSQRKFYFRELELAIVFML